MADSRKLPLPQALSRMISPGLENVLIRYLPVNTKYLQNLAYCRLKNLSIGYTLPDKWLSKIGFEKIRVYFSGENLLTFTKLHSDYIDPEQASASNSWKTSKSDANIYPWAKTYSFGVDITF